ncbi:hypothetical protein [Streptomyces parvulus]|uniref:hypothetical protein n=1 Tax=Streptomyces parvulus TaxID=146923 RepID=UPI00381DD771
MADEQDKWLDRETAELLLRGESPDAVLPPARAHAERLALALGALSVPPPAGGEELPGEEGALAAFRKAYAERADLSAGARGTLGTGHADRPHETVLVRIGRRREAPRRNRRAGPLRLGLVAALALGMVGGVAVAAGTGVLPTPFHHTQPEPAASSSTAESPDRPLVTPPPMDDTQGGAAPGNTPSAPPGTDAPGAGGTAADRTPERRDADDRGTGASDGRRSALVAACRKVRAGQEPDGAHRRDLKEAAGGSSRVGRFCKGLLAVTGADARDSRRSGEKSRDAELRRDDGDDGRTGRDGKGGKGGKDGKGDKKDGDGKDGKNRDGKGKGGKDKGGKRGNGGDGDDGKDGDDGDRGPAPYARDSRAAHTRSAPSASSAIHPLTCGFEDSRAVCAGGVTLSATRAQ